MSGKRLKLRARADFVKRLAQAGPLDALEELIWNSFDESAKNVVVSLSKGDLDTVKEIHVSDDGNSLAYDKAQQAFENLGNSDKAQRRLETGERLHGSKGEGRHKSLSLGTKVIWQFVYKKADRLFRYRVEGNAGNESPFYLYDEEEVSDDATIGCTVAISDISKTLHSLLQRETRMKLTSHFAPFLIRHPDRLLQFDDRKINPKDVIQTKKSLRDVVVERDSGTHTIKIQVIHWKSGTQKELLLCSSGGIPLHSINPKSLSACVNFSVFATSDLFDEMHESNSLSNLELTEDRQIAEQIRSRARKYFRRILKQESEKALDRLRDEGSYPYEAQPESEVGRIEQKVFDICTINISRHLPSFNEKMDVDARRLMLRIVKEAVSQNPTTVGKIIREVCNLPVADANTFAELLESIPLNRFVQMGSMIADRLHFLKFFEAIVYLQPFEKQLRERTQLHRILSPNTWLFGEEYALGSDDEHLKTILERHVQILGREHLTPVMREQDISELISAYNTSLEKSEVSLERIPDLMLWRKYIERKADLYEFVIVEFKRPGVAIGRKEISQIEDYARAVVTTPFADSRKTRWLFILVSDRLDAHADERANNGTLDPYTIFKAKDDRYEIRAMPWSQIIRMANARHEFLQSSLEYALTHDQMISKAQKRFSEHLPKIRRKPKAANPTSE